MTDMDDCTRADYDEFAVSYRRFLSRTKELSMLSKEERRKMTTTWEGTELSELRMKWPTERRIRKVVQYLDRHGLFKCIAFLRDGTRYPGFIDHMGMLDSIKLYHRSHDDSEWRAEIAAETEEWMREWESGTQMREWSRRKDEQLRTAYYNATA